MHVDKVLLLTLAYSSVFIRQVEQICFLSDLARNNAKARSVGTLVQVGGRG